ncbi:heparinase II/III family protein [bacterium]|nr:heparinase II/III family protein [bacterium]
MRTLLVAIALSTATLGLAQIQWDRAPEAYQVGPDGAIEISDGGGSTPDKYLLTAQDFRDFALEFDMVARPAGGPKLRAIIVWAVQADKHENRKAFFLPLDTLKVGEKVHFRLLVLGGRSLLYRDGQLISSGPTVYGEPPAQGRVGFLHYYNHNVRYEHVKLQPLDPTTLAPPTKLQAIVTKGGAVRLTWGMTADYADLLRYRVRRGDEISETAVREFVDRTVRSNQAYTYTVEALAGEGVASRPATVTVRTGKLPPPKAPQRVTATVRLDGSVRLRWQLDPDSRCAGLGLTKMMTPQSKPLGVGSVPVSATEFLVPGPASAWYAVNVKSPDGGPETTGMCQTRPMAPALAPGGGVPAKHPYLLYGAAQLERARRALQTRENEKLLASLRSSADGYVSKPATIPTGVTDEMSAVTSRLQQVGLYYQLLGDERYAQWVHDALLGYAKLYPTLPARGGRVKITKTVSGLYEAVWFVPLVCAYDLAYESPCFTAAERAQIERDLLRPGAELFWVRDYHDPQDNRPGDLHYKCYNFQAWFDSAVGLTGLLLQDADMVEHAIDGPYGLKHLLAHDVQDDGLFWERSAGYHSFVISALFPLLQAAARCNLDLYKLSVPDDYNTDREPIINYCVGDGDNGPKSMKLMFDGPFYYTFPDLTWPVVADSGRGPLSVNAAYRAAWEHTRDPKYAWLINRGRQTTIPKLGAKDAAAKVWLAWDDQRLYVAADITDQVVRNSWTKPGDVWQGDALWVGLKWRDGQGGPYDFIYGLSPGDFDKVPPVAALFNRFGLANAGVSAGKYVVTKTPEGYALELAIPLSELAPQGDEQGTAFVPREGGKLTADFVLYDCDSTGGNTTKEKMVCWSCQNDRYDSAEGGTLLLSSAGVPPARAIVAPRASGLTVDGKLTDWVARPPTAVIGPKSVVMTDASSAGPNLDDLLYERPPNPGKFDYSGARFCNNGVLEYGSSLFPSSGLALLRQGDYAGKLPSTEGLAVNMTFGPYGGGHNHPDKLSLAVWNNGKQLLPDFGSCGYDSAEKGQWTAHTISHNTLTVDGRSQYPGLDTDKTWPCDSFQKRAMGKLGFFHADPFLRVAQASCDAVFEGVQLTRTVALVDGRIVDFYRVRSRDKHVYDYALHIDAPFKSASAPLTPLADPLGKNCGYQHIHQAQGAAATAQQSSTTWGDERSGLTITSLGGEPTELIVGRSITTALDRLMPMQILRREATDTIFGTILAPAQPYGGSAQWVTDATGVSVETSLGSLKLSPDPTKPCRFPGGTFTGAMAYKGEHDEGGFVSLVKCTQHTDKLLKLWADRPLSLCVYGYWDRGWLIVGHDGGGKVTLQFTGRQPLTLQVKAGQVVELPRQK